VTILRRTQALTTGSSPAWIRQMKAGYAIGMFVATTLVGCGANVEDTATEFETVNAAIGEAGCATVAADLVEDFPLRDLTTPESYGSTACPKAFVIDVEMEGPGNERGEEAFTARWGSASPSTQAACLAAKVRVDTYVVDASGALTLEDSNEAWGQWVGGTCELPATFGYLSIWSGTQRRVVVQAHSYKTTRKVSLSLDYLSIWVEP
jgi:hypothetical protein